MRGGWSFPPSTRGGLPPRAHYFRAEMVGPICGARVIRGRLIDFDLDIHTDDCEDCAVEVREMLVDG